MTDINKSTHFIMFVPKIDIGELDLIEEADEETKKECWEKLKGKEIEKISGLSISEVKPGFQFKVGYKVTQVQQIGTGAVIVSYKPIQ